MADSEPYQVQIAAVAQKMLSGDLGIVEGCRHLVQLCGYLDEVDDELLLPIVAVESETEDFPLEDARSLWSEDALARKDAEVKAYLSQVRGVVFDICQVLVSRYSATV